MAISTRLTGTLRRTDLAGLRSAVRGTVLTPEESGYDDARSLWNGSIDRRPSVIVRAAVAADVAPAIAFARAHDLPLSVRGGGHNVSGSACVDDGAMLHLGDLRTVTVDPSTRRVVAEPGTTMVDLDTATTAHGLGVSAGIVTHTGVAGLTLGGGIGWLMRRDGLSIDRLRAVTLVTADGRTVRASEDDDAELFWAVRGGGGNFGVVTAFEYEAAPLDAEVTVGVVSFDLADAPDVLRRYRDWAADAPDEITTILTLRTALPLPAVPAQLHGRRVLNVGLCHTGSEADGARQVAALRALGTPIGDTVGRRPFIAHQRVFDPTVPWGHGYYWKSLNLPDLADEPIDRLVDAARSAGQPWSYVILFQLGGAVARVASEATAYPDRGAAFTVNINGVWALPEEAATADARIAWTRETYASLEPYGTGASYVNFLMLEGEAKVRSVYGPAYDRLAAIKARWDPDNLFRSNQNVAPRAGA